MSLNKWRRRRHRKEAEEGSTIKRRKGTQRGRERTTDQLPSITSFGCPLLLLGGAVVPLSPCGWGCVLPSSPDAFLPLFWVGLLFPSNLLGGAAWPPHSLGGVAFTPLLLGGAALPHLPFLSGGHVPPSSTWVACVVVHSLLSFLVWCCFVTKLDFLIFECFFK